MSNIYRAFENGKAFIPFITCGDPDLDTTERVVLEAVKNGADLIELGIPFSDPTAEGPVIQGANVRALRGGATTDRIFSLVRRIRQHTDTSRNTSRKKVSTKDRARSTDCQGAAPE